MLLDANDTAIPLKRNTRVLIIGGGLVGLTLARKLSGRAEVLLVEAGGLESNHELDALNDGQSIGLAYPLTETRTRRLGGSLALWAGWIAPFDAGDFCARGHARSQAWPFGRGTLEPFFPHAATSLNLRDLEFDAHTLARCADVPLPLDDGAVRPTAWRFGTPTRRLGADDVAWLESARNVTVLMNAHAVDLRLNDVHDTVRAATVRTVDGREGRIAAGVVVLACGGIETARLLLNANDEIPAGVANSSGLVGRCFMEHPHMDVPALQLVRPEVFEASLERQRDSQGREFMINFAVAADVQRSEDLLNARAHVYRTPAMHPDEPPRLGFFLEQVPYPASRITLSDERDALGVRKLQLDWRLSDREWVTYRRMQDIFIDDFERRGLGIRVPADTRREVGVLHSNHHLGTTRMSVRPDDGVVDANCRAHDVANLYLIGGNVFPTASWANPTFTLLALTHRLAEHLQTIISA